MISWDFMGLVLVVGLATIQGRVGRVGSFGMILLALPATVLHELSHFLVGTVTGGRPSSFTVIPRSQMVETSVGPQKVWTLGSVGFFPTMFSAVPTALSPLLYLAAAAYLYGNWFVWFEVSARNTLWLYLVIYVFLSASIPSWQDFKIVLTHPESLAMCAAAVALTVFAKEPISLGINALMTEFPLF